MEAAPPEASNSPPPGRSRVAWIDSARGVLVVLVVLGHSVFFLGRYGMVVTELEPAVRVAQVIRIPALFVLSGALFHHAAGRSWRTVLGTRIVPMVWVLWIWLLVELLVRSWRFSVEVTAPNGVASWVVDQALLPEDYLWFIWSLAVVTVVARLLRSHPVLLGAVAVAMVLTPVYPDLGKQTVPFFTHAPFFFVGFLIAPALRVRQRWLVVAGAVSLLFFVPLALARNEFGLVLTTTRIDGLLLVVLGLPAVALLGIGLSRLPGGGLWSWLGRRTLPIYVAHMPLLLLAMWLLVGPLRPFAEPRPGLVAVVLVVYAVGLAVLLKVVSDRLPFDGILAEPRWLRVLVLGRHPSGSTSHSQTAGPDAGTPVGDGPSRN
ncbi:MAG: acyltransferase family protein [Actinomycetales bacterium]